MKINSTLEKGRKDNLRKFLKRLNISGVDLDLLDKAFCHKSYAYEHGDATLSNEVLEFLGDSVLGFIIVSELFLRYPELNEGLLTQVKARIVSEPVLAKVARAIGLPSLLKMGKGERQSSGQDKDSLQADALEAVVAVLYQETGIRKTRKVVAELWQEYLENISNEGVAFDYKSQLQVFFQKKYKQIPHYQMVKREGPEHATSFFVDVSFNDAVLASGVGKNKKNAEQDAAKKAWAALQSKIND